MTRFSRIEDRFLGTRLQRTAWRREGRVPVPIATLATECRRADRVSVAPTCSSLILASKLARRVEQGGAQNLALRPQRRATTSASQIDAFCTSA